MLSDSDKRFLLQTARRSVENAVRGSYEPLPEKIPPHLMEPCGAFVTLHRAGELRGCIGYIEGTNPLVEIIQEVAEKAAREDYRFVPVTSDEVSALEIEISVLSPLKLINDIKEIEVGKHGLVIEYEYNRGLLLPQVAVEYGWDRETFLNQTARKAGLTSDKWKDPKAEIYIFSAEVFNEKEFV